MEEIDMLCLETQNTIQLVNKIEKYQMYDEYYIRFNNDTIYKSFLLKKDADLNYTELSKYLKSDRLIILKKEDEE